METTEESYEEFFSALDGEDGNQTDTQEEAETVDTQEESAQDHQKAQEQSDSGETAENEQESGAEEVTGKDGEKGNDGDPEQTFTIKVNKESKNLTLAEMTELAQKGADYDRTKGQLEESRQTVQSLQSQLNEQQEYMDVLKLISEQSNMPIAQLVEQLHINMLKGRGMSDAEAKAEIRAAKAEKALSVVREQQNRRKTEEDGNAARAQREVGEFRKQFPDVELTQELCEKLAPDIQAGMTMASAYLKMENARQAAEIADLKRQQTIAAQNQKNRNQSPGSQRDSGGQRTKTDFDEFMAAFQ